MISQAVFEAMHVVMWDKDNINPPRLINATTDFSAFDPDSEYQSQSQSQTQGETPGGDDTVASGNSKPNRKDSKNKKRKRSPSPKRTSQANAILDLMMQRELKEDERWAKDEKRADEEFEFKKQVVEDQKKETTQVLAMFGSLTDSLSRMAKE
jgi:hypothetical protein